MQYRTLGNSGTIVTSYALGTMTFGAEATEETSHAILDSYFEAGGNFIDTADVYSAGVSEEIIGRWLAKRPEARDSAVVATKGRFPMGTAPNDVGTSRRRLARALDNSLRRLGVEQVDLYQMHAWDPITPLEETLRFLDDAVASGKIAYYGFSNFLGWQLTKAVHVARSQGWNPPVSLQPQYSLLVRDIEFEIVPAALDAGIGLLPWSPLGGGWLSGKYQRDQRPSGATRLGENPERGMEAWKARNENPRTWAVLDAVADIASAHGVSHSQVALAWLADRPAVTSVILGARTTEQLADNLAAAELELTAEEISRLTQASQPETGVYPYGPMAQEQRSRKMEGGR
ncbi:MULTISPECIES: aldo/keto reductase [Arthrobacter]|uniref:aldo/keto reductase n=1 Tax=Arthrobacter TaxID=1663 RepID=UPI001F45D7EE|nr:MULTISPECIES: aldo/keto reductase [Arthrobacter]MDP9987545.1 aryl-alcohol dehydrogenase (NADP+) [Arthrobacter oryzae]UKA77241.1 aldo/keto reductase [Arthrobacter sp. FW306-07-I]